MTLSKLNLFLFLVSLLAISLLYLDLTGAVNVLKDSASKYTLCVGLLIPFSLLFLGYVPLRNIKVYLLWSLLAVGMLLFYIQFRDEDRLRVVNGSALDSFKSLFGFLLAFQVCRAILIKVTGREYVTPGIGGSKDLFEGIEPCLPDFVMFGILFFVIIASQGK